MPGKASFDDIYDLPDPRPYFRTLSELDYQTPEHARGVFAHLAGTLGRRQERFSVLDLCCSYGVNAALLNHDLTLQELYARYGDPELDGLSSVDLAAADRAFYARRRRAGAVPVVGLDAAANAVDYALRAGLLDAGRSENLEAADPSPDLQRLLADTGLITVTGGIGYVTERTFDRVLNATRPAEPPWVAALALRWVDLAPIAAVLGRHGITLQPLHGRTFRQRRFADEGEREFAFEQLWRLDLDPQGVETDGYHHTWLYVGRPRSEVEALPLEELLVSVL